MHQRTKRLFNCCGITHSACDLDQQQRDRVLAAHANPAQLADCALKDLTRVLVLAFAREIIDAADLPKELTFNSFGRHGGATESKDSGLTVPQLMEKGQWSSPNAMPRYLHGNDEAKQDAQVKRIKRRAKRKP